jgi:hypothetical protein
MCTACFFPGTVCVSRGGVALTRGRAHMRHGRRGRGAQGPPPRAFARVREVLPRAFRGKRRVALSPNSVRQTVQRA